MTFVKKNMKKIDNNNSFFCEIVKTVNYEKQKVSLRHDHLRLGKHFII